MDFQGKVTTTGQLTITKTDISGKVLDVVFVPNLVVDNGKAFIAQRMKDATTTAMSHIACGSNSTTPVTGNTTLNTELGRGAIVSTTVSSNTITYVATLAPGVATGAIVEAGIFNSNSGGTMLARTIFNVINKDVSDTITITWVITIS